MVNYCGGMQGRQKIRNLSHITDAPPFFTKEDRLIQQQYLLLVDYQYYTL